MEGKGFVGRKAIKDSGFATGQISGGIPSVFHLQIEGERAAVNNILEKAKCLNHTPALSAQRVSQVLCEIVGE